MIAKFVAIVCLVGVAQASYLYGNGLGYSSSYGYGSYGHGGYGGHGSYGIAPTYRTYSAPIVRSIAYAPAISSVSRYVHSAPAVSSYVAPVASYSYSPARSYGGYGYGHSGYGYGSYGGKYLW